MPQDKNVAAVYPQSNGYVPTQKNVHLTFIVDGAKEPTGFDLSQTAFTSGSYGYGANQRVVIDGKPYQFSLSVTRIDSALEPFASERAAALAAMRTAKAAARDAKAAARKAK